jgi:cobalt-zinc-cadmium efflux system outer membrane protein
MFAALVGATAGAVVLAVSPSSSAAGPLNLERFQQLVRDRAPDLLASQTALLEARGARAGATPLFASNPSITGSAGLVAQPNGWRFPDWDNGGMGSMGLAVPVEIAGQRWLRVAAADARIESQERHRREVTRGVLLRASEAFCRALHAAKVAEVAQDAQGVSLRVLAAARALRSGGAGSAVDVELATLDAQDVAQNAIAAQAVAQRARAELLAALGLEPDAEGLLVGELRRSDGLPPRSEALRMAETRADVLALRSEGVLAARQAQVAAAEAFPTPTVGASYQYQHQTPVPQHSLVAQVTFPLPVFARGQGEEGRARARSTGLAAEEQRARETARAEVLAAYGLIERMDAMRAALPAAGTDPSVMARLERALEERLVDVNTLLNVQRRSIQARRAALDVDLQEALARVWLDAAMGVLQ